VLYIASHGPERTNAGSEQSKAYSAGERTGLYLRTFIVIFVFAAGGFLIAAGSHGMGSWAIMSILLQRRYS
jgi:hypothetical protein